MPQMRACYAAKSLVNGLRLPVHVVHQQVLAEVYGVVKYALPRQSSVTF